MDKNLFVCFVFARSHTKFVRLFYNKLCFVLQKNRIFVRLFDINKNHFTEYKNITQYGKSKTRSYNW